MKNKSDHTFPAYRFYSLFIDPILKSLRTAVSGLVSPGSTIIDFACGTGNQAVLLAQQGHTVTGIDVNSELIFQASSRIMDKDKQNLSFRACDGRNIDFVQDRAYGYATISLALHEMPIEMRVPVLLEMRRVAEHLIIADYASPLPKNLSGVITLCIEFLAGKTHFNGFKTFQKAGGLDALVKEAGLSVTEEHRVLNGIIRVLVI